MDGDPDIEREGGSEFKSGAIAAFVLWTRIWLVEGTGARRFDRAVGHGKNRKVSKGQVLGEKEGRREGSWPVPWILEETSS